jgi:hypothetical protein
MAVLKVNIEGFGDLPVTPPHTPDLDIVQREDGEIQSIRETWRFSGVLPVTTGDAATLDSTRDAILAAFQLRPAAISFTADGTPLMTINSTTHVNGAFFRNFNVERTGGEWVNLLGYSFEVFGEKAVAFPNILEYDRDFSFDEEVKDDGTTLLTMTKEVSARGPEARNFVESERPLGTRRATVRVNEKGQRVVGTFVVPSRQNAKESGTISIEERITVEPGIFQPTYPSRANSSEPDVFYSSRGTTDISIEGVIRGALSRGNVAIPVSKDFSKFLSAKPRFSRTVERRKNKSNSATLGVEVEFSLRFSIPKKISAEDVLTEREKFSGEDYITSEKAEFGIVVK